MGRRLCRAGQRHLETPFRGIRLLGVGGEEKLWRELRCYSSPTLVLPLSYPLPCGFHLLSFTCCVVQDDSCQLEAGSFLPDCLGIRWSWAFMVVLGAVKLVHVTAYRGDLLASVELTITITMNGASRVVAKHCAYP